MALTLLLVEDDVRQSAAVRSLFEESSSDVTVLVARSLQEAQSHQRGNVDAVLLDLDLPDSRGLATLTAILERFTPVPVIILSGTTDEDVVRRALDLGADDYLEKGLIHPAAIHRVVRYAMRQSRQRGEAAERDAQNVVVAQFGQLALGDIQAAALLNTSCNLVAHVLHVPGVLFMERTDEGALLPRRMTGCAAGQWAPVRVDEENPIAGAVRANRTMSIADVRETEPALARMFREVAAVSLVAVPVRTGLTAPEGALVVWRSELRPFGGHELAFLEAMANVLAAAMQRSAMRRAMRVHQQEVERILDAVPDRILRFDQNLLVQYLNHAAMQGPPAVRLGMHADELTIPPGRRSGWRIVLERALVTGVAERFDMEGIHESHHFDVSVVPQLPRDRERASAEGASVVVVLREITPRRGSA